VSFNDIDGIVEREDLGVICRGIDDMQKAVAALVADPGRRVSCGQRAREIVRQRFSAPVLARRYIEYFEELLYRDARARRRIERLGARAAEERGAGAKA
jgi:glycosyltransferase involved in cell wall biosynthesis